MDVIYLILGDPTRGVINKISDKRNFLREQGLGVQLCFITSRPIASLEEETVNICINNRCGNWLAKLPLLWRLSIFFEQWNVYKGILSFLKTQSFDLVLFRYPFGSFFLWQLMRKFKSKIVFEHNTIEIKELKIRRINSFYFKYFYYSEKLFGRIVRCLAAGIIGVTEEITKFQVKYAKSIIPHTTISNGIDINRIPIRKGRPYRNGEVLNLVLLAGSEAPWHGVDILLRTLISYSGPDKVHCYIAGNISSEQLEVAKSIPIVTVLPTIKGQELDELIDVCHIGIGSLGFTEAFLTQACPLKVREYWARGLPFLIGYDDADLIDNMAMAPFYLRVEVLDCFNLKEVVAFADRIYKIPNVANHIHNLALQKIHYKVKAGEYVSFFKSIIK